MKTKYINKPPTENGFYFYFNLDYPVPTIFFLQQEPIGWKIYGSGGYSHGIQFNSDKDFRSEQKIEIPPLDFLDKDYRIAQKANLRKRNVT